MHMTEADYAARIAQSEADYAGTFMAHRNAEKAVNAASQIRGLWNADDQALEKH